MNIRIEGIGSAISKINAKYGNAQAKVSKGIAKGCKIVEGEAKALCPVSTEETRPGGPHGELRQSITSEASGNVGYVGTNKEYGGYVELGTYKMAAQPYLAPALKNRQGEVVEAIKDAIKNS